MEANILILAILPKVEWIGDVTNGPMVGVV